MIATLPRVGVYHWDYHLSTEKPLALLDLPSNKIEESDDFDDSEDDIEDVSEPWFRYTDYAHYLPMRIGELVDQRYLIEHKLGHGGYSTVWMAYDSETKSSVALKISTAGEIGDNELYIQDEIRMTVSDTTNIMTYQDTFVLPGQTGLHRALVLPLRGPDMNNYPTEMPIRNCMSAARQLLVALANFHNAGFVHGGKFVAKTFLHCSLIR